MLSKNREFIVNNLIKQLEGKTIPWEKPWKIDFEIHNPINPITKTNYKGINALTLFLESLANDYEDNRWMTFNQIKNKGYTLKKGSKGVPIEFFQFKDKKTGKEFDFEAFKKLTKEEQLEKRKDIYRISKHCYVFNGSSVEGLEPLKKKEIDREEIEEKMNEKIENIISNMELNQFTNNGYEAYYMNVNDTVNVPKRGLFKDDVHYYGTILHELAHATMHEKRLDRKDGKNNRFGTNEYALEELRAEIASMFVQHEIGMQLKTQHERNYVAYIQNWLDILKNKPEKLIKAIEDADRIADFLKEKSKERNLECNLDFLKEKSNDVKKSTIKNAQYAKKELYNFKIDNNNTKIGTNAFSMNNFEKIDLSKCNKLKIIEQYAFYDTYAEELILNKELEKIEDKAFKDNNLKFICFEENIKYIGEEAFAENKGLKKIEFKSSTPPIMYHNTFLRTNISEIVVPVGAIEQYKDVFKNPLFLRNFREKDIEKLVVSKEEKVNNIEIKKGKEKNISNDELTL